MRLAREKTQRDEVHPHKDFWAGATRSRVYNRPRMAEDLLQQNAPSERTRLTLEQLRIFVAVAERQHMTQAAQALNLTQSATSSAIAALEERHGVRLFDRLGRRIVLTAAGKVFLGEAKALLAQSCAAERTLADLAGLKIGSVSLAASQTVGNYWLPPLLKTFVETYPGLTVKLQFGNTESVAAMAAGGEVDLGFVEGEVAEAALAVTAIGEDELVVVAAPDALKKLRGVRRRLARRGALGGARTGLRHPGGFRGGHQDSAQGPPAGASCWSFPPTRRSAVRSRPAPGWR